MGVQRFVRRDLKLSLWDVKNKDLNDFYEHLDTDGDGLEVEELLAFVQSKKKAKTTASAGTGVKAQTRPTYRQKLLEKISWGHCSQPMLHPNAAFVGLGRSRAPTTCFAVANGAMFVDQKEPASPGGMKRSDSCTF